MPASIITTLISDVQKPVSTTTTSLSQKKKKLNQFGDGRLHL